jgi:hypothetical protein
MRRRSFRPSRRTRSAEEVDRIVYEAKREAGLHRQDYRAKSLALYGWICAKRANSTSRTSTC